MLADRNHPVLMQNFKFNMTKLLQVHHGKLRIESEAVKSTTLTFITLIIIVYFILILIMRTGFHWTLYVFVKQTIQRL